MTSNRFRPPAMLAKIAATVDVVSGAGFEHVVLGLSAPYPPGVARWVARELIGA